MSQISLYQNRFRLAKQGSTAAGPPSKISKRHRESKSCLSCQIQKLKCDRQSPCSQCFKRGEATAASCKFVTDPPTGQGDRGSTSKTAELQRRLQQLEQTISSLAELRPTNPANTLTASDTRVLTDHEPLAETGLQNTQKTAGGFHLSPSSGFEGIYSGATNWAAVLGNIRDVQEVLKCNDDPMGNECRAAQAPEAPECDLVFGSGPSLTTVDIWQSLPPRQVADTLVSVIFESGNSQSPIIHSGKFLKEYEAFWQDPSSTSFLWVSMLFSVLWMGSYCLHGRGTWNYGHASARPIFLKRAGQALVAGKYHQAKPYALEALLMHAHCKYHVFEETDGADANIIIGIASRVALKMGYHRDPRYFVNISPFEGEMRRRAFYILKTFDLLISFNSGLPSNIHDEDCDTESPRNLLDEDFDEDCLALPPSRPVTDRTPMLYFCYKSEFTKHLKSIIRHALSPTIPPYSETIRLDAQLRSAHSKVPPGLQMKPFSSLLTDTARMLISRLHIELLYLKSLCVLHRPYLTHQRKNPAYKYARTSCLDAAMRILHHQDELHQVSRPGARFENNPWMLSTLTQHDFLLAAMIVALDLYETFAPRTDPGAAASTFSPSVEDEDIAYADKHEALQRSRDILSQQRAPGSSSGSAFKDGRRAASVLTTLLAEMPPPPAFSGRARDQAGRTEGPDSGNPLATNASARPDIAIPDADATATGATPSFHDPPLWSNEEELSLSPSHVPAPLPDASPCPFWHITHGDKNRSSEDEWGSGIIDWGLVDQYIFPAQ